MTESVSAAIDHDAHGLYSPFGFGPVGNPDRQMEILRRNLYLESRSP